MEIRSQLKKFFPKALWPCLRGIDKYIVNTTYFYLSIRRDSQRRKLKSSHHFPQKIFTFRSQLSFASGSGEKLEELLQQERITCRSGRHSVYIFLPDDIRKINKDINECYPGSIGLKIIKSRQIAPDNTPYYTSSILAPASSTWSMKAVGSMEEKKAVSNLLHLKKVAPRVYDIVKLESEDGSFQFAFVVQHIDGDVVHGEKGLSFINRFKEVMAGYGMETISITEHCDLRPPEYRDNIVRNENGIWYVDIQNFVLGKKSIADSIEKDAVKYLSQQGSPARGLFLDSEGRAINWEEYKQVNQLVLDELLTFGVQADNAFFIFGAHTILQAMVIYVLYSGALWCHLVRGSDALIKFLFLNGCTRFSYDSQTDSVYSRARKHPKCLSRVFFCTPEDIRGLPAAEKGVKDILLVEQGSENMREPFTLSNWRCLKSIQASGKYANDCFLEFYSRG